VLFDPDQLAQQRRDRRVAEQRVALQRAQDDDDLRELLSSVVGRRFIWRLAERTRANPALIADSSNPHETFLRLGAAQAAWVVLQRALTLAPEHYMMAAAEAKDHEQLLAQRAGTAAELADDADR
jgi:hypothetical protein